MRFTIRTAYIFYFLTLSKGIGDAQSFLGYVLPTRVSFRIRFSLASRAHPSQEGYDEQKPVVVVEVSLILGLAITWEMQGYANVANASQRHR